MSDKREAAEKLWAQLNEKMTSAQKKSLQRLNDALEAFKGSLRQGRYNELQTALVLASAEGALGYVPVRGMNKDGAVLANGVSETGQNYYVLCTSPEEAAMCPESVLCCVRIDAVVTRVIRDKAFAGLWLNPYGGNRCSVSREDLALYYAMADLGVLDNDYHEKYCGTDRVGTENGKPKRYGDGRNAGTACILVYEQGIGDHHHPFWEWLREEGFHSWGCHGNYGMDWVFINLNSMEYAPGMPGMRLAYPIREHAVTLDEFMIIWKIYRKYDGFGPLVMPENSPEDEKEHSLEVDAASFCLLYRRMLQEREVPQDILAEHAKRLQGKGPEEQKKEKEVMALEIMEECPYKLDSELELREKLRRKGIDERNWLKHLDRMTEREITFMLEQLPDKASLNKNRRTRPTLSDRVRAEFLRDFG